MLSLSGELFHRAASRATAPVLLTSSVYELTSVMLLARQASWREARVLAPSNGDCIVNNGAVCDDVLRLSIGPLVDRLLGNIHAATTCGRQAAGQASLGLAWA